mgnify:CR=1 FL=1
MLLGDYEAAASSLRESLHLYNEVRNLWGTAFSLVGHTPLLTAQGRLAPALHLAAAAGVTRQASGAVLLPFEKTIIDETRTSAYRQLGEATTHDAWREGEAMALDEAVVVAMALISDN